MKKHIITAAMLVLTVAAAAQDTTQAIRQSNNQAIKVYGFIRNYLTLDSRKTYTVIGDEYNMIPYDIDTIDGVDVNNYAHAQMQALTSRIGLDITGPMLLGMQSSGKLEGDFGGFGTNNHVLRLRLAYLKLKSEVGGRKSELTVGQDWHPLSGNIMPEVLGMAAGAPFRPHSRTPQVRATQYWGNAGYTAALLWQLQYMNNGPASYDNPASVASLSFARHAVVPEGFFGVNYNNGPWYAQFGFDGQVLCPRGFADVGGVVKQVDEIVFSLTPTLYAQYVDERWSVKFRTMIAQNTSHLNQLVGYAVTGVNADGSWNYEPLNATISYFNIAYGRKVRYNLFLGYMKNLGLDNALLHSFTDAATGASFYRIYMKGGEEFTHLNSVWRVAPSVSYNVKAFNLGLEYELTAATYGDIANDGSILLNDNLHQVVNHRLCALVKYNF